MATSTLDTAALIEQFQSIGLSKPKATEAVKSPKSATVLKDLIQKNHLASRSLGDKQASLVLTYAIHLAKPPAEVRETAKEAIVVDGIVEGQLKSVDQVNAAAKYFESHSLPIDRSDYQKLCGIGFSITPEDLKAQVTEYISNNLVEGWPNLSTVIGSIKSSPELRWASPLELKNAVESVFTEKFGPKGNAPPKAKEAKTAPGSKVPSNEALAQTLASTSRRSVFEEGFLGALHKPGGNPQIHPYLREAHVTVTKGEVWTRFPPEPNGYLHIGHAKAIFVDFGYAAHHGGKTYLRYDDTNPEAEEERYFESILEMVRWLGYEPWKITYSSDYFDKLYTLAVELIKRDKAYVCHCSRTEISINRGEKGGPRKACVHRSRPIEESLREFENMRLGKYRPQEANLRMKQDLEDGNPQMWDLTAYRILDSPHHRTKDKWKIYPTYDYTHCLVDSFENISHSLCTTEFVASRQSYEWLCDALEVYRPKQSEFGRLGLEGTITSKRKILELVNEGYVRDWDDPRLYTLIALRRRGIPPGAIINFVSTLGVSTAASNTEIARFEHAVRNYLETSAPRLLMVLRPLKVVIENLPEDYVRMVTKPLHPKVPTLGSTTIPFTGTIYIEEDDFRVEDSKDYFRLAPGKTVGLFQAPHPITCISYKTDPYSGRVIEVTCRIEDGKTGAVPKPKAYIQWVAEHSASGSPVLIDETRIFHQLFKSGNPLAAEGGFKADIAPNTLEVVKGSMLEIGFWPLAKDLIAEAHHESKLRTEKALKNQAEGSAAANIPQITSQQLVGMECIRFQGLRVAYFAVDKDSRLACLDEPADAGPGRNQGDYLVLNQIVSLKEDPGKGT